MDELAAEVFGSAFVEQDDRDLVVDRQSVAVERHQVVRVGRPGPGLDRPRAGSRLARRARPAVRPSRAGVAEPREQPELDAEVDEPRAVEPAEAGDEVVEAVVEGHRAADCRMAGAPPRVAAGYRTAPRRGPAATVAAIAGFWGTMDTDSPLIAALADDLDGSFEALVLAHQDRLYSIALRVLGDPRDAEEAAQDAFVRAYRALAGYDPARIRELRLRPWLATIVLNLCRSRLTRRPAAAPPVRCRSTRPCRASSSRGRTKRTDRPRRAPPAPRPRDWAELLLTLPPAYRSAVVLRHVDGLSYPELAIALDRPEGTVKAQVHRGLALLRTAFEAAQRREREEMTA